MVFRLEAAPYSLAAGAASLVFFCYLAGTATSRLSSTVARRLGVPLALPTAGALVAAGIAITLARSLWIIVVGIVVLTAGVFLAHATANGQVAHVAGDGRQHAIAIYTVIYYVGSSVFGTLGAIAWGAGGWPGLTITIGALAAGMAVLGLVSRSSRVGALRS